MKSASEHEKAKNYN